MEDERYEPDQPQGPGGRFGKVSDPRPPHGHPQAGYTGPPPVADSSAGKVVQKQPSAQPASPTTPPAKPTAPAVQPQVMPVALPPGLTSQQKEAVTAWLGPQQPLIQAEAVSGNSGSYATIINNLKAAILTAPAIDHDQLVYRGVPPQDQALVQGMKPHATLHAAGFLPTSTTPLSPLVRNMNVTLPRGTKALSLPGELLLSPGSQLRLDDVPANGNVEATYMGQAESPKKLPANRMLLAQYRSLWMRTSSQKERDDILEKVRKLQ